VIKIITSGAFAAALEKALPIYKSKYGLNYQLFYGSSFGEAHDSIPNRIKKGEFFDFFFLAEGALDNYIRNNYIDAKSKINLVNSRIGIAIKEDGRSFSVNNEVSFVKMLIECKSIAYAASASGIYLCNDVFPLISNKILIKSKKIMSERVGNIVLRGEAEVGFQQFSELLPIKGLKILGGLPNQYDKNFIFSAGCNDDTDYKAEYFKFIDVLTNSDEFKTVIEKTGVKLL
jgi:molybdate transport system substrate-binding protein